MEIEEGELPDAVAPADVPAGPSGRRLAPSVLAPSASEPLSYEERERSRARMPMPPPTRSMSMLPPHFVRGGPGPPPPFLRDHPRVVLSPRGLAPPPAGRHHGGRILNPPAASAADEQARQAGKDEREKEELTSLLRELTRYVTVQDAMRSLDTVCVDLKKAIKKLDKLLRKVKKKKTDDLTNYPDCLALSKRIAEGLRSVNVVIGTSIGHTHSMDAVLALFRAAMNYRHDVFVAAQKQELEGWVKTTKVLKVIVEEKEQAKQQKQGGGGGGGGEAAGGATANGHGPASGSAGGGEGGRACPQSEDAGSGDEQQAAPPTHKQQQASGDEAARLPQLGQEVEATPSPPSPSHPPAKPPLPPSPPPPLPSSKQEPLDDAAAATATATAAPALAEGAAACMIPPPPPEAPPPPAEPHPDDLRAQQQQRPDANGRIGSPSSLAAHGSGGGFGVLPSGSGTTSTRARPGAAGLASPGFRFSIVVNSTAADIVLQQQQQAQGSQSPHAGSGELSQPQGRQTAATGPPTEPAQAPLLSPEPPPAQQFSEQPPRRRASAWDQRTPVQWDDVPALVPEAGAGTTEGPVAAAPPLTSTATAAAAAADTGPSPMPVDDSQLAGADPHASAATGQLAGLKRPHTPSFPLLSPPPLSSQPLLDDLPPARGDTSPPSFSHKRLKPDPDAPPDLLAAPQGPPSSVPLPHHHHRERGWDKSSDGAPGRDHGGSEPPSTSAGLPTSSAGHLERLERDRGRSPRSRDRSPRSRDHSARSRSPRDWSPRDHSPRGGERLGPPRGSGGGGGGGGTGRWEPPRFRSRSRSPHDLPAPRGATHGYHPHLPHHRRRESSYSPEPGPLRGGERGGGRAGGGGGGGYTGPGESPVSEDMPPPHHGPPHHLGNGHLMLRGPLGGWLFEDRERHRLERERLGDPRELLGPGGGGGGRMAMGGGLGDGMPSPGHMGMGGGAAPLHGHMWERDGPAQDEVGVLLQRHRLVLALDLDHTLLNSVRFADLEPKVEEQLGQRLALEASTVPDHQRELYRSERLGIWTKLRPGAREFLGRAVDKFELWVYSAGTRPYADAMASLLDPEDRYFEGRIVAAGGGVDGSEGPSAQHNKRLLAGLAQRSPVVLAVDDAGALWPAEQRLALLAVERYLFFPATRRRFGLEGRSLLQINRDECPDRGMLMTMWHLMERLHGLLFTYLHFRGPPGQLLSAPPAEPRCPPWDMRNVLHDERRKVLHGIHLAFSRVFPAGMDPRGHPLWCLAEAYGAVCDEHCSERTTHVVAAARGTEKTLWAAQNGKLVVTPAWLECCCTLWRRADESRFLVPA